MNRRNNRGYTLIEMLVTLGLVAILSAITAPPMMDWLANQTYKEQAREILQSIQLARSETISKNLEHRVKVDTPNKKYIVQRGNRSANSSTWDPDDTVSDNWILLPVSVATKSGTDCDGNSVVTFHFNPNGSSTTGYVCVFDPQDMSQEKYKVGVASATSGRPTIE